MQMSRLLSWRFLIAMSVRLKKNHKGRGENYLFQRYVWWMPLLTQITMVDEACQTDLPFVVHSPHKFKSIPLADARHAITKDHSYAALLTDSPVVPAEQVPGVSGKDFPKSKRMLDFSEIDISGFPQIDYQEEEIEDEWIPSDVSDHEESDMSDLSDYEGNEFSTTFDSEDEDLDIKPEILYDDEETVL